MPVNVQNADLLFHLPIVVSAAAICAYQGYLFSRQFDGGQFVLPGLEKSCLSSQKVDLSDQQWRQFRASVGPLSFGLGMLAALSRWLQLKEHKSAKPRLVFYCLSALAFLGTAGSPPSFSMCSDILRLHPVQDTYMAHRDFSQCFCCCVITCWLINWLAQVMGTVEVAQLSPNAAHIEIALGRALGIWTANCSALIAARLLENFEFKALHPIFAFFDTFRCISYPSELGFLETTKLAIAEVSCIGRFASTSSCCGC